MGLTNVGEVDLGRHPGDDDQGEEEGQAKHQNLHCIFHCEVCLLHPLHEVHGHGHQLGSAGPQAQANKAKDPRAFAFAGAFVDAKLKPKKAACR